jgi:hypothetical protein
VSDVARPDIPQTGTSRAGGAPEVAPMWHVTLTLVGEALDTHEVRAALERLAHERPFLLSARYAADRAELRYWEEARDLEDAAALALRLWGEHRLTAELPPWRVAGLEVVDRSTFQKRATDSPAPVLVPAGGLRPL